ncbi:MAG: transcriptional regulator [Actinobacteria bacterium]|nr:MAG: transcriptional regulator [Actinomycetota bacterium]
MSQMTWRASQELLERVRRAAERRGRSMNDYVTAVLDAATDPNLGGTEVERARERLERAGLLAAGGRPRQRPPAGEVAAARERAAGGTSVARLVAEDR